MSRREALGDRRLAAGRPARWRASSPRRGCWRARRATPRRSACKSGRLGHTLVLVDKSDPWSPVQAERLKRLVKQIGEELPADRMLSIYVFNDVFEPNFPPLLSLCNPGRTVSELIGNPRRDYRALGREVRPPARRGAGAARRSPAQGSIRRSSRRSAMSLSRRENAARSRRALRSCWSPTCCRTRPVQLLRQRCRQRAIPSACAGCVGKIWPDARPAGA